MNSEYFTLREVLEGYLSKEAIFCMAGSLKLKRLGNIKTLDDLEEVMQRNDGQSNNLGIMLNSVFIQYSRLFSLDDKIKVIDSLD